MNSKIFSLLFLLALFMTACNDDKIIFFENHVKEEDNGGSETTVPRLFEVINLDYPGLEKVKAYYDKKDYSSATSELLEYYRNREDVTNPNINLGQTSIGDFNKNIADQALEYRFYIKDKYESKDASGKETYVLFKQDDEINWNYIPEQYKGDAEFVYQLHRHQWMIYQANAYTVTHDEKYVKSWIEVYGDWLKTFPCPEGKVDKNKNVEWYGLQPAHRVQAQLDIMSYFIQSENFTPEWLSTFLVALSDGVECIRKNYYKETNILITQVESVVSAGILMPEFKKAGEWLNEGTAKITEQVEAQFLGDGVHVELTPGYHIEAVYACNKLYNMAQVNNKVGYFPANYVGLLKKAARFVMDITYPDYSFDNFNDTGASSWTKSVLLGNFRRYMAMFPDDKEIAWMATEGKQGKTPEELIQLYKDGGYYMLRSKWAPDATMMVLKNNNNPKNYVHCQPDNGTFSLYRDGRNFLPDAGFFTYGGDAASDNLRKQYRATTMHNTMTKNAATIADGYMNGKFLLQESKDNIDVLVTENKSYGDLTHRRAVFFVNKTFFVLVDEGYDTGKTTPVVDVTFNLGNAPKVVVDEADKENFQYGAYTKFDDNNNMQFKTFVETNSGYVAKSSTNWSSSKQNEKTLQRKWYRVSITKPMGGAARFITVIHPFTNEADRAKLNISAKFTDNTGATPGTFHADGASVEVSVGGTKYDLSYKLK